VGEAIASIMLSNRFPGGNKECLTDLSLESLLNLVVYLCEKAVSVLVSF
jgi:hypothetical protein